MKTGAEPYKISKPFILGTGAVIKINGKFQEFPTEKEAWEFYVEQKGDKK